LIFLAVFFEKQGEKMNIILASQSPRRREILENLGVKFVCEPSDVDETVQDDLSPDKAVMEISKRKAVFCLEKHTDNVFVISADTVVVIDGKIIGKPTDEKDAFNILKNLSGRTHEVYTGYTLCTNQKTFCDVCCTKVTFKNLSDEEILRYISTREPLDKAGAYGIQGKGAVFVREIQGDYLNVVGLPASRIFDNAQKHFNIYLNC